MLENIRKILLEDINKKLSDYNIIKKKYDDILEIIKSDNSEEEYLKQLKSLEKEIGTIKKLFGNKEYKEKKIKLDIEYQQQLLNFKSKYDEYSEIRSNLAKFNIYELHKKIDKINNASSLKQMGITKETAEKILSDNGITFELTKAEIGV